MDMNFKTPQSNTFLYKVSDTSTAKPIGIFTAQTPSVNPYKALFNPKGYNFFNMPMSEFKNILNVIIQLESDISISKWGEGARPDEFSYQLNRISNAIATTQFNGRIDISCYFLKRVEEAKDMIGEDCISFIQVHNNISQLYNTVLQLTSEEGFRAIQNKALTHLKEQQAFA
jgi:hypothetical protein